MGRDPQSPAGGARIPPPITYLLPGPQGLGVGFPPEDPLARHLADAVFHDVISYLAQFSKVLIGVVAALGHRRGSAAADAVSAYHGALWGDACP